METHFGLHIAKNDKFDALQDIAARLFICPRISPEHATKMLNLLVNGKLSIESFIDRTDTYIKELSRQKENGDDIPYIMNNKLDAWVRTFKTPTHKDYEYLEKTFGFSKEDLLGTTAIETAKDTVKEPVKNSTALVKSAKEMAAYVKQFIKGQNEAIDKLSVPFYQHLDSKRKQYTSKIKTPVLVMGPTGVGKSEMFRIFGKICDCPVIRINSSEIVPAAWRGLHINDILAREVNDNILQSHIDFCSNNNVDLVFEEDAIRYIAAEAHKSGLGFRNVKTLLSKALNRLYYDLPEGTNPKKKLIINISKDYVMQNINVKQL